ncbi:MAG: MXAN_6640 family putative metalloprotease, partial [bacterium]
MRKAGWVFPILVFFQFSNIFGKQNLPVKCGTPFILSGAKHSLARPIMDRYSDTRHFRIWYSLARPNRPDTTDINPQNGIPDYVDKVKDIFEYCYSMIINTFGYLPPIPDSSCEIGRRNVGGDDRIDVYIMELYGSYYGETVPDENLYNDPTKAPGYIIIDNDYMGYGYDDRPIDALKVTAAHEFFHLAQFAYDYTEDIWWMEATAVFMEEQLYPYVNDYIAYIGDFLAHPEIPLNYANTSDNRIYGTSLFPIFLSRRFGWAIVKSIWEYCARPGFYSMSAIRRV